MLSSNFMGRRLQISGTILLLGLLVEAFTLLGRGPLVFVLFVGLGGLLLFLGIVLYLLALVQPPGSGD